MSDSELADLFVKQISTVVLIGVLVYVFKLWWDEK
tara:strand:- start:370 stop:474 length:105 start_codon:yes stop_codon:yes gene_type:complete